MPGRTSFAALAVVSTRVAPMLATTAPWLCRASLPVSKVSVLSVPCTGPLTRMGSATNGSFPTRDSSRSIWSGRAGSQLATPPGSCSTAGSATGNQPLAARCAWHRSLRNHRVILAGSASASLSPRAAVRLVAGASLAALTKFRSRAQLPAQAEICDDLAVALDVDGAHVVEHAAAAADEHEQPAAA